MTALQVLEQGTAILDPVLNVAGFAFSPREAGRDASGAYATGQYDREERRMTLYCRASLRLVTYRIGHAYLDHAAYLRFLNAHGKSSFLQADASDPMDGFISLRLDLEAYFDDFLYGSGEQFVEFAEQFRDQPRQQEA